MVQPETEDELNELYEAPPPPGCGDTQRQDDEACDDGNRNDGDGCSGNCLVVENGYTCTCAPGRNGLLCETRSISQAVRE